MQAYHDTVQDQNGNIMPTAQITVTDTSNNAVTVYSNNSTSFPITQPFTPNQYGQVTFYAPDGRYTIHVTYNSQNFLVSDVLLADIVSIQNGSFSYADDTGAVNAYVITLSPAAPAYKDGMVVGFSTVNTNTTTTPTLNVNGLGAITITDSSGIALQAGLIKSNTINYVAYNSTGPRFELMTRPTFLQSGTGAVARTVQDKERDFVNVKDFGATGDGVTNDTSAIQAALTASKYVRIPAGRYIVNATLIMQQSGKLIGDGSDITIIQRTANYGDTIQVGTVGVSALDFEIAGIQFYKPQTYVAGTTTTITYPVTAGSAHINVYSGVNAKIHHCIFQMMPYGVILQNTTVTWIENNSFYGMWDHLTAGLQEGLASIYLKSNATNFNVLITIAKNYITGGYFSVSRNITIGTNNFNSTEQIGPRYGVLVDSCEGLDIYDNYIGGQNDYCVLLQPNQILTSVKVWGNFFDSGLIGTFNCVTQGVTTYVIFLQITGNSFNGQLQGLEALRIDYPSSFKSVTGLIFSHNTVQNYLKNPIVLTGVVGATVQGNVISNYHARGGGTNDPAYSAGIRVYAGAVSVNLSSNIYGGGANDFSVTNNCQWGAYFNASTLGTASNEIAVSLGLGGGALVQGISQTYPNTNTQSTPSFLNSWVASGAVSYWKDITGHVHIDGLITTGTPPSIAFNLPAGFRPLRLHYFSTVANDLFGEIRVATNGDVTVQVGSATWTSLSGITFLAA